MGPKILAAFGGGALAATVVLLIARHPEPAPPPAPQVVAEFPEHVASPEPVAEPALPLPAKPPTQSKPANKTKPEKRFRTVATVRPKLAPAPAAISLPDSVVADVPEVEAIPITAETGSLPPRQRQTVTVAAGTLLQVRLAERLATDRNVAGDAFAATLDQPLVVDGYVIADKGARVLGRIVDITPAGRVQGVAEMVIELSSLTTADGQKINLRTARFTRKGDTSHRDDAVKVGAGAAIGAVIGAIAGGGKGAAIGAASGGAAGTTAVLVTRGKAATLDAETRLSFKLESPVTITER